ncbi:hypothetical protein E2C01_029313 [Portunus trituberculatus]|uniref:Uncharacterized protein n=1 Tax=Portunus trituberculatus TaxID=210409 RepID=A0A5B7ERN1_PORTR|nr:hypothetical protein [Portunus trituberculatus]
MGGGFKCGRRFRSRGVGGVEEMAGMKSMVVGVARHTMGLSQQRGDRGALWCSGGDGRYHSHPPHQRPTQEHQGETRSDDKSRR